MKKVSLIGVCLFLSVGAGFGYDMGLLGPGTNNEIKIGKIDNEQNIIDRIIKCDICDIYEVIAETMNNFDFQPGETCWKLSQPVKMPGADEALALALVGKVDVFSFKPAMERLNQILEETGLKVFVSMRDVPTLADALARWTEEIGERLSLDRTARELLVTLLREKLLEGKKGKENLWPSVLEKVDISGYQLYKQKLKESMEKLSSELEGLISLKSLIEDMKKAIGGQREFLTGKELADAIHSVLGKYVLRINIKDLVTLVNKICNEIDEQK